MAQTLYSSELLLVGCLVKSLPIPFAILELPWGVCLGESYAALSTVKDEEIALLRAFALSCVADLFAFIEDR